MAHRRIILVTAFMLFLVYLMTGVLRSGNDDTILGDRSGEVLFAQEILPILQSRCWSCHGEGTDKLEGNLDLRTAASLAAGGDQFRELIVSGRPELSPLYQAVSRKQPDLEMPPKEGDALSEEEVQAFYSWIVAGAPWPGQQELKKLQSQLPPGKHSRVQVNTSAGLSEDWNHKFYRRTDLWAYRALQRPDLPAYSQVKHPIDAFIQAKLDETDIEPAPPATKEELIKRVYFDLWGLPPTLEEVQLFVEDDSEHAYEDLIDRLLSSQHYGEQWARHWLDVVRYADSDGFSNDYVRPNAWRYRDYVIRSFNRDMPYDQFIRQQVAGDEIDPQDPEHLIAAGFLRMGPWEHTGMSVAAETRQYFLDDVTNIVGETFLATPLNCARCHDHKYDPVPTRDYYQIQAVFATTQLVEREAAFLPEENRNHMASERLRVEKWLERIEADQEEIAQKEETAARQWYQQRHRKYLPRHIRRKLNDRIHPPRYIGLDFADLGYRKVLQKRKQIESRNLERFEPWAFSVYNGPFREVKSNTKMRLPEVIANNPPATMILMGGSVYAPSDTVRPGVLSVLHHDSLISAEFDALSGLPETLSGRRKAFAEWLAHPDNPLTARVMVNRIWQHHFGKGLAENPNNFGATGKKPNPFTIIGLACF